jgi:hypothetical protein
VGFSRTLPGRHGNDCTQCRLWTFILWCCCLFLGNQAQHQAGSPTWQVGFADSHGRDCTKWRACACCYSWCIHLILVVSARWIALHTASQLPVAVGLPFIAGCGFIDLVNACRTGSPKWPPSLDQPAMLMAHSDDMVQTSSCLFGVFATSMPVSVIYTIEHPFKETNTFCFRHCVQTNSTDPGTADATALEQLLD